MATIHELARILASEPSRETRDGLDAAVVEALRSLRIESGLEVAFVSRFENECRDLVLVDQAEGLQILSAGMSNPIAGSWCHRVASGAIPQLMVDAEPYQRDGCVPDPGMPIGTHISVPIVLRGGEIFGTLCAFSRTVNPRVGVLDLHRLQGAAILLAHRIDRAREAGLG